MDKPHETLKIIATSWIKLKKVLIILAFIIVVYELKYVLKICSIDGFFKFRDVILNTGDGDNYW